MIHSDLVVTIVLAILLAFAGGFVASKLGIPTIVGYLLAGVAIGPYTPGGSADISIAADLAEIGVILLMFGVGLHFSVGDLLSVRRIAVPGALFQILTATILGFGLSRLWGWDVTEGIIFGLTLSVASTVVLLRALEERAEIDSRPGHIAVGWLIVEDLFTVAVLILLPAILGGDEDAGLAALVAGDRPALAVPLAFGQAAVFIVLMLVVGRKVIPLGLMEVSKTGSREMFTLCILATALGFAFGASEFFGVSLALGAFLAGVILNESDLSQRAATEALPFRDAFAVIFFVSVGMLFDPSIFWDAPERVAAVVAIVVVGKSVAALAIVVFLGYGVRNALVVSAGLAQVGEFSFILAGLAMSLGHFSDEAESLVLAAAVISITLNPLFFRAVEPLESQIASLGQRIPALRPILQPAPQIAMDEDDAKEMARHVVVLGYGLVGRELVTALSGRGFKYLVVESDPNRFDELRQEGVPAVYGDATNPSVLAACSFERARMVAITFSGATIAKIVLGYAKERNPRINVIVRGRAPVEYRELIDAGATEVIQAELEAGLEFVNYALRYYGVDRTQIQAFLARRRGVAYGQGG